MNNGRGMTACGSMAADLRAISSSALGPPLIGGASKLGGGRTVAVLGAGLGPIVLEQLPLEPVQLVEHCRSGDGVEHAVEDHSAEIRAHAVEVTTSTVAVARLFADLVLGQVQPVPGASLGRRDVATS